MSIDVVELDGLRERFQTERSHYEELANRIAASVGSSIKARGVRCVISARAKEVPSFVKKVLRKRYQDPWAEIRDKAGVRVVVAFEEDLAKVESLLAQHVVIIAREDKRDAMRPTELNYLGIHLDTTPRESMIADAPQLADLECEIQLHTAAQDLWAVVAHGLLYKAPQEPAADVQRSIYRLLALLELFDGEISRGRERVYSQSGYREAIMLHTLERQFLSLAARDYDEALSREVVELLSPLYTAEERANFDAMIQEFVGKNRSKLSMLFVEYAEDPRNPFMSQPESLIVFERLENDRFRLAELWGGSLPDGLLESLAEIWGKPLDV